MGQQQLLLIVLGIIIIGIAIIVGINYFRTNAIESKRDSLTNELMHLATMAQQYYIKPRALGGGSRSFIGWEIPVSLSVTPNGNYSINSISATEIEIIGTGNEVVTGNDSVKVKINIHSKSFETTPMN